MNLTRIQQILDSDFYNVFLEKEFAEVRERVQRAMDASPECVSFEQALKQVRSFSISVSEPDIIKQHASALIR